MGCGWKFGSRGFAGGVLALWLVSPQTASAISSWKSLGAGIQYTQQTVHSTGHFGKLHLFRVNLKYYRLSILQSKSFSLSFAEAKTFAEKSKAPLVINGGFFSPEFKSLGLLVENGKILNAKHPTRWWSIFHYTDQVPHIDPPQNFEPKSTTEVAIQVGPRLLINRSIPPLKSGAARRSAIGLDSEGSLYLAVTESTALEMSHLAQILKEKGLTEAMNLDGGGSTQLYVNINGFQLNIPGETPVANALGLFVR